MLEQSQDAKKSSAYGDLISGQKLSQNNPWGIMDSPEGHSKEEISRLQRQRKKTRRREPRKCNLESGKIICSPAILEPLLSS